MKKFLFSLEKIKKYREQILDIEKNKLSVLREELKSLHNEIKSLNTQIETKQDEIRNAYKKGVKSFEIGVIKRFIAVKRQDLIETELRVSEKEQAIELQLDKILTATRDVKTMEKLEEKQFEQYQTAEQKEQELFIEEFVSNVTSQDSEQI